MKYLWIFSTNLLLVLFFFVYKFDNDTVLMDTIQNDGVVVIGLFPSLSMVSKIFSEPSGLLNNHIFLFPIYFMANSLSP